jgi:hypothetical protein
MAWTFYNASGEALTSFGPTDLTDIDVANGTDVGAALAAGDEVLVYDTSASANKKSDVSRIATYVDSNASGSARAWVSYDYGLGTPTILGSASFNVEDLGDDGTGHVQINFTNNMSQANHYVVVVTAGATAPRTAFSTLLAASADIKVWNSSDAAADLDGSIAIFGVLA